MSDTPLPPADQASPMAAFRNKGEIRPHMLYKYEQNLELTGSKARQLRDLQAFVEWQDFCSDAIAPLLYSMLSQPDSGFVQTLRTGIQDWKARDDEQRLTFLKAVLVHLSSLLHIAPPALTTRDLWVKSLGEDSILPFNPGIFALYRAKARTIILNHPGPLKGNAWHYITMMAHETAHHLIRVKAEELFDALEENIAIPNFRDAYPHDRVLISQHPLCAVISACEEYRCDEEYQNTYHQEYMDNQDTRERPLFLEEILAFSLEDLYTLNLREALFMLEHGYTQPCAQAYAQLILTLLPEIYRSFIPIADAYQAPYKNETLELMSPDVLSADAYRTNAVALYQAMQEMSAHAGSLTDIDHPLLHELAEVKNILSFLMACTGRFEAYDEDERDQG